MGWVVAFVGQKGGTGKSRLAQALAVEAARSKIDVLLADMDSGPTSSSTWAEIRATNGWKPPITCEKVPRLDVAKIVDRADLVVLDTAGIADKITRQLADHSHVVVVPVGSDVGDWIPTLDLLQQMVRGGVSQEKLAPTIVRASSEAMAKQAREWMTKGGFPPLPHETYFAATYSQAFNVGKAMTECSGERQREQAERQVGDIAKVLERLRERADRGRGGRSTEQERDDGRSR
jgi:chromosome partitioning protein